MTGEVTLLLERWRAGEAGALERVLPVVYDELRRVAKRQLAAESSAHTLSATALVHEVYLRLVHQRKIAVSDREHFLAVAAKLMRRILVDHARAKRCLKRGGGDEPVGFEDVPLLDARQVDEIIALDDILEKLAKNSERAVRVVECRIFAGLTLEETAKALDMSSKSVQRTWTAASAWLRKEIGAATV